MVDLLPEIVSVFFEGAIDSEVMEAKRSIRTCFKTDKNWKSIIKNLFHRLENICCMYQIS